MSRLFMWVALLFPAWVQANPARPPQALLMGGGLKICSSFSPQHCIRKTRFSETALDGVYQQSSQARLAASIAAWQQQFTAPMPARLQSLLERFERRHSGRIYLRSEFRRLLSDVRNDEQVAGKQVLAELTDDQYYFLLDHYQLARIDEQGKRVEEQVMLDNSDPHSQHLVNKFLEMAQATARSKGKVKATVLVSTASASDVFDAVGFYTQLFQTDHVDVHWLPLEAALQAVWHKQQSCARLPSNRARMSQVYDRQRVYPNLSAYQMQFCLQPDLFRQLIIQADGLFFNGGDQSLTLQSLAHVDAKGTHPSALNRLISQQFRSGRLVLGGSSAGTAVFGSGQVGDHPRPMISNGASLHGFIHGAVARLKPPAVCGGELGCDSDQLTYLSSGGFNWLDVAVFDTHFSERDRAFRLARLLADTANPLGIGVDENTGLLLTLEQDKVHVEALGEGGVWLLADPEVDDSHNISTRLAVLFGGMACSLSADAAVQHITGQPVSNSDPTDWLRAVRTSGDQPAVIERRLTVAGQQHSLQATVAVNHTDHWPHRLILQASTDQQ